MGTKKFDIKTFESFTRPVIEFQKKIYDTNKNPLIISPGKENPTLRGFNAFSIDIHEIKDNKGAKKNLRDLTSHILIELSPDWINKNKFQEQVTNILNKNENPEEVLKLSIRLICPKINYVIESKQIDLREINSKKSIEFGLIDLADITEKIVVQSELIRSKSTNPSSSFKAHSKFTILSRNNDITFYVDKVEAIGSNALPIEPGAIGERMFIFKNTGPFASDPPTLVYNEDFKFHFNGGDDFETVQAILILIGFPYCEQLLRWIVFGNPNYSKEEHQVIIRFIGELCEMREMEFENLTQETDFEKKNTDYLELSNKLFLAIQNMGNGWKKMLGQIIKNEQNEKI